MINLGVRSPTLHCPYADGGPIPGTSQRVLHDRCKDAGDGDRPEDGPIHAVAEGVHRHPAKYHKCLHHS